MTSGAAPTFAESGAPPPWVRALLWVVVPLAAVGGGWLANGPGGAAGGAVGAACVLLAVIALEWGCRRDGGVTVVGGRLFVGRNSVPVAALDLTTLGFVETPDVYRVFGSNQLKSNPLWLRHTVALDGHHDGRAVHVMVRTDHPDELVAALRAATASPES